jgi:hypothetical protein
MEVLECTYDKKLLENLVVSSSSFVWPKCTIIVQAHILHVQY